jgi:hypothetical protein
MRYFHGDGLASNHPRGLPSFQPCDAKEGGKGDQLTYLSGEITVAVNRIQTDPDISSLFPVQRLGISDSALRTSKPEQREYICHHQRDHTYFGRPSIALAQYVFSVILETLITSMLALFLVSS